MGLSRSARQGGRRPRKSLAAVLVMIGAIGLGACEGRLDTRGNLPDPERLAEIVPGQIRQEQVAEVLGSPSHIAAFGGETWYYVSQRTRTFAFFEPEVVDQRVVMVRFDEQGIVRAVDHMSLEDANAVALVERETPTTGTDFTILDQLLGNIGRFQD